MANKKSSDNLPKALQFKTVTFGNPAVMAFSGFRPVVLRHRLSAVLPFRGAIETIVHTFYITKLNLSSDHRKSNL